MEIRPDEPVLSVAELNRAAKLLLEGAFPAIWVEGELSNFTHHGSGHMYFDLKDDKAQVRAVMFRGDNRRLGFRPASGQQVLLRGRLTVYELRGSYQLVADHMEPAGEGLLRRRLEETRARLEAEGLFAMARKRDLPSLPRCIGVVTSPSGAAIRDILKVLQRRFPAIPVIIYPAQVQGDRAKAELVAAIETAGRRAECDVLIVGRGGGSLEDLWAFNEEVVVRAIHASPIPVVSAVGHESDTTLADFVADLRAPTPSAAAELVTPDATAWLTAATRLGERAAGAVSRVLRRDRQALTGMQGRLQRCEPKYALRQHAQRLDELSLRLGKTMTRQLERERTRLTHASSRLGMASPLQRIRASRQALAATRGRLDSAIRQQRELAVQNLAVLVARMEGVSPLATLGRGYALVRDAASGALIRDSSTLKPGQSVITRLAKGEFSAVVRSTGKDD